MAKVLGLDLGMASVGFALLDFEAEQILCINSHIFDKAEIPKTGASLAEPRRKARGARRRVRRKRERLKRIRALLVKHGFKGVAELDKTLNATTGANPWILRKQCLSQKLSDEELAQVLLHIAKHRGFQSNRKEKLEAEKGADKEKQKMLGGMCELETAFRDSAVETVGAYLADLPKQHNNDGEYTHTIKRDLLREEVRVIFEKQRAFGQSKLSDALLDEYGEIAFTQLPIAASIGLVGFCDLEPEELRAPKNAYTAEQFLALSRLNNLRIVSRGEAIGRKLTQEERNLLLSIALKQVSGITYKAARKKLELTDDENFNITYRRTKPEQDTWEKVRDNAEKGTLISFPGYQALRKTMEAAGLDKEWQQLQDAPETMDQIAFAFSFFSEEAQIREQLAPCALSPEVVDALLKSKEMDFTRAVSLSLKAMRNILPHMREGNGYAEACAAAGYHHSKKAGGSHDLLPPVPPTRNPVVDRTLAQARKIVNQVIRRFGMPDEIHIEFARDLGKSKKQRDIEDRENKKFAEYRVEQRQHAAEFFGHEPNGLEFMKYRLWKEQKRTCPYSGKTISCDQLKDPTACQVDHALPHSRFWDDSYSNKVLCLTDENQRKGKQTPYEYLVPLGRWDQFLAITETLPFNKRKRIRLKAPKEEEFKSRNLNDTRYICRAFREHILITLKPRSDGKAVPVLTVNGRMTDHMRHTWGLGKKERENDLHHAIDAAIVAGCTWHMVERLNNWTRRGRDLASMKQSPRPWATFREDLLDAVGTMFVSRQPRRKGTGPGHADTIVSGRTDRDGKQFFVKTVRLGKDVSYATLANLVDVEVVDGVATGRNRRLYNVLKARLDQHRGKGDKAFVEPVYMPTNDGKGHGPAIKSVKVRTNDKSLLHVPGRNGYAANGSMVRVDVFRKDGKYYLVPVYTHHIARKEVPNRVCTIKKPIHEWKSLDESYFFVFSLHSNDYVVAVKSSGEIFEGYFTGININSANMGLRPHYGGQESNDVSVQNLKLFEKYAVNIFGELSKVRGEKRHGVEDTADRE